IPDSSQEGYGPPCAPPPRCHVAASSMTDGPANALRQGGGGLSHSHACRRDSSAISYSHSFFSAAGLESAPESLDCADSRVETLGLRFVAQRNDQPFLTHCNGEH